MHFANRCLGCLACVERCPQAAVAAGPTDGPSPTAELCDDCGECREVCFADARVMMGRSVTLPELMDEIRQDAAFYRRSGGGVTLGGGEVTAVGRVRRERCSPSAGPSPCTRPWRPAATAPGRSSRAVAERADLVLYDLKHADPEEHERRTGLSNALILDNLRRLVTLGVQVQVRVPVVPGFNDDTASLRAIARVVAASDPRVELHLLPYHRLGEEKYAQLGRERPAPGLRAPADDTLGALVAAVREEGLVCRVGR